MNAIPINCWAIVVSMVVSVILGFLWYGPLFGKQWMALSGIKTPEQKPGAKAMIKPIVLSLIGAFFMSFALSHSLVFANAYLQTAGISAGLTGAFWMWIGFIAPVTLSFVAWEGKSWKLWLIHNGYWLVLLGVMGMILSTWV